MIEQLPYMPEGFEPEQGDEQVEWVADETTTVEYLNAACYAYQTADAINDMKAVHTRRKNRIKRKSLQIIDKLMDDIHKELIDNEEGEDDE